MDRALRSLLARWGVGGGVGVVGVGGVGRGGMYSNAPCFFLRLPLRALARTYINMYAKMYIFIYAMTQCNPLNMLEILHTNRYDQTLATLAHSCLGLGKP